MKKETEIKIAGKTSCKYACMYWKLVYLQSTITTMVMMMRMITMRNVTIVPAMAGTLLPPIGNKVCPGLAAPGVAEDGTDIVLSAVAVLDNKSDVVTPEVDVFNVMDGVTKSTVR